MAARLSLLHLLLALLLFLLTASAIAESVAYSRAVKAPYPGHTLKKLTHINFYLHDVATADKPTTVVVANAPTTITSATLFGMFAIFDDPLTVGPERTSEEIGRGQGMYTSADQNKLSVFMAFNLVFSKGEFSGSSIAIYGRNPIMTKVTEMQIIGGTGAFTFGTGYAQVNTLAYNNTSGNAVFYYNVNIWH